MSKVRRISTIRIAFFCKINKESIFFLLLLPQAILQYDSLEWIKELYNKVRDDNGNVSLSLRNSPTSLEITDTVF